MQERQLTFKFQSKEDRQNTIDFLKEYRPHEPIFGSIKERVNDFHKNGRKICRFCSKNENEVSFKQITHIIPQMLNKAKPISNFECDECNEKFSKYENDFSNYYSLHRALFGHAKKHGGINKLKTNKGGIIQGLSKSNNEVDNLNLIAKDLEFIKSRDLRVIKIKPGEDSENFKFSEDKKTYKIVTTRKKYKPLNVYRTLLKIALSFVPQNEFKNYTNMLNVLNSDFDNLYSDLFSVIQFEIPKYISFFESAMVMQFSRRDLNGFCPQRMSVLYLDNKIIQIPLFSDRDFMRILEKKESYYTYAVPPILNPKVLSSDQPNINLEKAIVDLKFKTIDLSSIKIIENDSDQFEILC